jgi:hypothetical protein
MYSLSEVAFAFCHLLGFKLMPRLKAIHSQKLYRPEAGMTDAYPNLQPILTRPINWELIRQQYDQMMKYASHINPYGTFRLNMKERLPLEGELGSTLVLPLHRGFFILSV